MIASKVAIDFPLATMTLSGQQSRYSARVDRAAFESSSRPALYFVSVVATDSVIKAIRSTLSGVRTGMTMRFIGLDCILPNNHPRNFNHENIRAPDAKFKCYHQKIGYGLIHAMFVARHPDFLLNVGEESLWRALNEPRFTTPLLRHWMPWLADRLIRDRRLLYTYGHRCRCGLLKLKDAELDQIVSNAVRDGHLTFTPRLTVTRSA
jgi:hypothetical protein